MTLRRPSGLISSFEAALLAAGYYYGGGSLPFVGARTGASGFGTKGIFSGLKGAVQGSDFFSKMLMNKDKTGFSPFKVASFASPLLAFTDLAKVPANENIGMGERGGSLIDPLTGQEAVPAEMRASLNDALDNADGDPAKIKQIQNAYAFLTPDERLGTYLPYRNYGVKDGGRIGYADAGPVVDEQTKAMILDMKKRGMDIDTISTMTQQNTATVNAILSAQNQKAEGGIMDLGGMEKDYRAEGGFVPIGREEKADDVPARLSVNEFVFTADAVRNAGGGDIDRGAEVMENMMKNLENGGRVSEESQGNTGAQDMFSVSERIGEVI